MVYVVFLVISPFECFLNTVKVFSHIEGLQGTRQSYKFFYMNLETARNQGLIGQWAMCFGVGVCREMETFWIWQDIEE